MAELNKGYVVFKHKAEDFIVEEVWKDYVCNVSDDLSIFQKHEVDLGKLDVNDRRPFLTCELEKLNLDHFSVLSILAKELNNLPHELGYAGTKDKIAWTCQKISIFNANIEKIKSFSYNGIKLKNFKWEKHKIKIGDLEGNRFTVVLRDVDKDAIKILNKVRNSEYLPNLFGPQRFGSLRKENVLIGKLIFKKRFKEAVFEYLTAYGDNEDEEIKKAKKRLKVEKNIMNAKIYFPKELRVENRILDYLSQNKDDWLGALEIIGEKTLLIMCQAVQSKLFNDILEWAIEEKISLNNSNLVLLGYNSQFSPGKIGEIEREVLRANGLEFADFKLEELPFLSLRSSTRKAFFKVRELDLETNEDDLFPLSKKITLNFILDSGVYATTFLEQFFVLRD